MHTMLICLFMPVWLPNYLLTSFLPYLLTYLVPHYLTYLSTYYRSPLYLSRLCCDCQTAIRVAALDPRGHQNSVTTCRLFIRSLYRPSSGQPSSTYFYFYLPTCDLHAT
ncbi:hypothetical protein F5Y09DRAFT_148264 [Xylaria sp. FL1042]|nr:hypothetical protein F5Y09DRAFT_148264 [Xylaria sp. FL1042]